MAPAIGFVLVMLGRQVCSYRELRLAFQHLRCMRGSRHRIAHLGESSREEGMMGVVRPRDPRKRFCGFGIFLGAIAGAPEVVPESLRVIWVEAHRPLDPVDAFFGPAKPRQKLALLHDNEIVIGI